jgi:hypothetical protein
MNCRSKSETVKKNIGELDNLTTKIITLLEFCSTCDQVTADAFGNLWW